MDRSRRIVLAFAGAALALVAAPIARAQQGGAAPPRPLSDLDRQDVARAEAYLNGLRTLTARFIQIAESGGVAEGTIHLQRPGRLRLDYADPTPLLVIAARGQIIQHDRQLRQTTYLPLSSTPAAILLRENVSLAGEVAVTRVERGAGVIRVTIVQADDPRAGRLTLVFSERPMQLTNWVVVDAQGATTRVSLSDIRSGVTIDPQLFVFQDQGSGGNRN